MNTGLSPSSARWAWTLSLDALDRAAMSKAQRVRGRPFVHADFVAASTVFTAPVEWCALLLARGTSVHLKHPHAAPGAAPDMVEAATRLGLPMTTSSSRTLDPKADLLIAMGDDPTIHTLRAQANAATTTLLFGHRFSVAWADTAQDWTDLAHDALMYDGRGCLSPSTVFTDRPLEHAVSSMAAALDRQRNSLPGGQISPIEAAQVRERGALARVLGAMASGEDWSVHGLPATHLRPVSLPRSVAVISVANQTEAAALLAPHRGSLSTVGDRLGRTWHQARVTHPGQMQRPPLNRLHDGVHLIHGTIRPCRSKR
jgi:hypothetical protein